MYDIITWLIVLSFVGTIITTLIAGMRVVVYLAWEIDYDFKADYDGPFGWLENIFNMLWTARSQLWAVAILTIVLSIEIVLMRSGS